MLKRIAAAAFLVLLPCTALAGSFDGTTYKQMLIWLSKELPDTYKKVITFIRQL